MDNLKSLRCITQQELCALSKLSEDYWLEVRKNREIDFHKFRGCIRYTQEDLENYYKERKVEAKSKNEKI